jgi:hypothetical protein
MPRDNYKYIDAGLIYTRTASVLPLAVLVVFAVFVPHTAKPTAHKKLATANILFFPPHAQDKVSVIEKKNHQNTVAV